MTRLPQLPGKRDHAAILSLAEQAVASRRGWSGGMRMEDDPDDDGSGGGGGGNDDPPDPNATVTIEGRTWKIGDLQRLAAEEKRQGKRSGQREVLEALGVKDQDEAKALIEAARQRQKDQETEAERKAREAQEARDAADREKREAAQERRQTQLERVLVRRGVNDDDLDDAVLLLSRGLDDDADADAIADAADKLKERRAELFGEKEEGTGRPPRRTDLPPGDKGRKKATPGQKFGAGGLARAERRFGKQEQSA